MFFFKLKNNLLWWEIDKSGEHPAKWEKKGSALYTVKNVTNYPELRRATFRYLNKIRDFGGYVFYFGIDKSIVSLAPKSLYQLVLKEAIKRLNQQCGHKKHQFLMVLDQQDEDGFRSEIVETASISMFGTKPMFNLLEPPIQAESHLYQTLQCADWVCGVVGRLTYYDIEPHTKTDYSIFDTYFRERLRLISKKSSVRRPK